VTPLNIFTAFYDQGGNLAALITPYALRLLYLLLFVEVGTIAITWMRGNDDIPDLLWRLVYLLFSSAFAFWWITDSWALGKIVLGSFHLIGQNISGASAHRETLYPRMFTGASMSGCSRCRATSRLTGQPSGRSTSLADRCGRARSQRPWSSGGFTKMVSK
jgi:hypothetical protein